MLNLSSYNGVALPAKLIFEPALDRRYPKFCWAADRYGMVSSGAGSARQAKLGALGEFQERRHFNSEVVPEAEGTLAECVPQEHLPRFRYALAQCCGDALRDKLDSHRFKMVMVTVLPTFEEVYVPGIFVELNSPLFRSDRDFLPSRDTTGCSAHVDRGIALASSVNELAERQCLLKYWLTAKGGRFVDIDSLRRLRATTSHLLQFLKRIGQVEVIDITLPGLTGNAMLVTFKGGPTSIVKYCVGLSFGSDATAATDKAISELWQSYLFLVNVITHSVDINAIKDKYHRYFIECNRTEIADMLNAGAEKTPGSDEDRTADERDLIGSICGYFGNIFIYHQTGKFGTKTMHFIKSFSPDVFLSIENNGAFNMSNRFSNGFRGDIHVERSSMMVPFP